MILPVELVRPVIAHVPGKDDLAVLAQVSHCFQAESERILYRSVILHRADDALANALSTRRRALLVRECSVYFAPLPRKHQYSAVNATNALLALLARMRNLSALSLRGPFPAAGAKLSFPFRLRSLCTTEALASRTLLAFLRSQPSLTRLTLLHPDPVPSPALLPPLPNAHALATLTPAPALALLPHRPISHLHILAWARTPFDDAAHAFARSHGPLRALMVAQGLDLCPADLGLLAMHCPALVFLADLSLAEAPANYLPALARLPLRTLLINRASPGLAPRFSEPALVRALAAACPTLTTVVFTQRVTATYVWRRPDAAAPAADWRMLPVDDPCEVAADLWRAA